MFENLKEQIAQDLNEHLFKDVQGYIDALHDILPKYLTKVPDKTSYEFYEFAAKFGKYLYDTNQNDDLGIVYVIFNDCPTEYNNVICGLESGSGEDLTDDVIAVLNNYREHTRNTFVDENYISNVLDVLFGLRNWHNLRYNILNWNKVVNTLIYNSLPSVKDISRKK